MNYAFSIIATDYENHVPRMGMKSGLNSLANQSFKNFELIVIHDGPKKIPYEKEYDFNKFNNVKFMNSENRFNDWGHSLRDIAMREAKGEYFLHFNIDNLLYSNALEMLNFYSNIFDSKIFIFEILHWKIGELMYGKPTGVRFPGLPPVRYKIDLLQLVAHRDIWEKIGYWYDKDEESDGIIYQHMCNKYGYEHIPMILGEQH